MPTRTNKSQKTKKAASAKKFKRVVVVDKLDLRDRPYMPTIAKPPEPVWDPPEDFKILNQGDSNACTGFALASVVYQLMRTAKQPKERSLVSPFMLYSMARRYDEFPGDPKADTGSSLRGAMKGWYKHGVCRLDLWKRKSMPEESPDDPSDDWWLDAANRPLGAYYRVDKRSVTDMHVALNEVGILYASAICHSGWDDGFSAEGKGKSSFWAIPPKKAGYDDGGHAFVLVGYNSKGFIIQNSWGTAWGTGGRAMLSYEDWLDNAMDCWVAQLGVVTELHLTVAKSSSLRWERGRVQLASEPALQKREISPFIINMENNGRLSNTGEFRTQEFDVAALVGHHLETACKNWKLSENQPVDIAIYAHGGLTSEEVAAKTAAKWIPALYDRRIFPIFMMWETDLWSTLKGRLEDKVKGLARPTGGFFDDVKDWWNERLERLLTVPGSAIWGEMKQNAEAISTSQKSGGVILYKAAIENKRFKNKSGVRLHLIGHSAGAIVHSHIINLLAGKKGWKFETVNFMAPAVTVDVFHKNVTPQLRSKAVRQYNQFHLTDEVERKDPTCRPILGYTRSLLYLVSGSFEKGRNTPILGMKDHFDRFVEEKNPPSVRPWEAPGKASKSTTHGGFDDDDATMKSVIDCILKASK